MSADVKEPKNLKLFETLCYKTVRPNSVKGLDRAFCLAFIYCEVYLCLHFLHIFTCIYFYTCVKFI